MAKKGASDEPLRFSNNLQNENHNEITVNSSKCLALRTPQLLMQKLPLYMKHKNTGTSPKTLNILPETPVSRRCSKNIQQKTARIEHSSVPHAIALSTQLRKFLSPGIQVSIGFFFRECVISELSHVYVASSTLYH